VDVRGAAALKLHLRPRRQWRAGIELVALDPSAPFAAAIRRMLP
jgi:hypothetical protein